MMPPDNDEGRPWQAGPVDKAPTKKLASTVAPVASAITTCPLSCSPDSSSMPPSAGPGLTRSRA